MKLSKFFKTIISLAVCFSELLLIKSNNVSAQTTVLCPGFSYEDISPELQDRINGKSFKIKSSEGKINDWVRFEDLRYLKVKHWGYDEKDHDGELIVHSSVAQEVLEIFKELYDSKFPIYQMKLIENYDVDDDKSMAANNSHAFRITEGSFKSKRPWHGLGLAIDINPLVNPCIYTDAKEGEEKFVPFNAEKYLDRGLFEKGMIKADGSNVCYNAFIKRGWEWGGSWNSPVDLHHFQKYPWYTEFPRKYKDEIK